MNDGNLKWALACMLGLGACGGGGHGTVSDAGPPDSSTPSDAMTMGDGGGGGFDPSMTYAGEGAACEFSILCGDQQLCVDDACIRHERLDPANVSVSDYRVLFGDEANPSPLIAQTDTDWFDRGDRYYSYLFPGHDGPALVFSMHSETRVDVAILDDHFRYLHVEGIWMTALGYSPDGLVMVGGADNVTGRPRLVMFDHEDHMIFDELTDPALDDEVHGSDPATATALLGVPQSFLWNGDHFEVAFALGDQNATYTQYNEFPEGKFLTPLPPTHTILGELTPTGEVSLKPLGADLLVPGARAWLVEDERGVGVILSHGLDPDDAAAEITTEWHNLATAESSPLATDIGSAAEYFQPSQDTWYYVYQSISMIDPSEPGPFCTLRAFRNSEAITIGMEPRYCRMSNGFYEGIALPSDISLGARVLRESDPFLMEYRGDARGIGMPDPLMMYFPTFSSDGTRVELNSPFVAEDGCYQPGFNGFPVSRFGLSTELIITGVGVCRDPGPFPDALLVEGHLVTGG